MEDGTAGGLPTKEDQEFKPFVRRLPEFKFWYSTTKAVTIAFVCSWFQMFDLPVFWPVLVVYWLILFILTSKCDIPLMASPLIVLSRSAQTDSAHDQIPLRSFHSWQDEIPRRWKIMRLRQPACSSWVRPAPAFIRPENLRLHFACILLMLS